MPAAPPPPPLAVDLRFAPEDGDADELLRLLLLGVDPDGVGVAAAVSDLRPPPPPPPPPPPAPGDLPTPEVRRDTELRCPPPPGVEDVRRDEPAVDARRAPDPDPDPPPPEGITFEEGLRLAELMVCPFDEIGFRSSHPARFSFFTSRRTQHVDTCFRRPRTTAHDGGTRPDADPPRIAGLYAANGGQSHDFSL